MTTATLSAPPVFDHLSVLSDGTRARLLGVLEGHELAVSELCVILQAPQSTVSRHLKVLTEGGWLRFRPEGTSRLYRLEVDALEPAALRLWEVVREEVARSATSQDDALRLEAVLAERRSKSREFFDSSAGRWDQVRQELFGERFELWPLLGFLPAHWTVGDLGCGTGQVTAALAPFVHRVVAVDGSPAMVEAAQERLAGLSANGADGRSAEVDIRRGQLEALPLAAGSLDAALLMLVLHHVAEPPRVLAEAARVLRPGGRLLLVDMNRHEHEEYRREMGHVWLGFEEAQLGRWLGDAGLELDRWTALPPDPAAKGPTLFAASARRRP